MQTCSDGQSLHSIYLYSTIFTSIVIEHNLNMTCYHKLSKDQKVIFDFRILNSLIKPGTLLLLLSLALMSCSTTKKVKDGATAFQQKQYAVAVGYLSKEAAAKEGTEEYAGIAYMLGESYKNLNEAKLSLKWYIEAAKNGYGPEAFWEMSYALKKDERYEDAILSFRRLGQMVDRDREINLEIQKCIQAQKWKQLDQENQYIVEALVLNSSEADYAPSLWRGRNLVFTSDRMQEGGEIYAWTGNSYADLYVSDIDDYNSVPFDPGVNTPHNEGSATFSKDGTEMYFTRCHSETGDSYCRLYKSIYQQGRWQDVFEVFRMKSKVHYRDPVLIENDSVLIFTSNDPTGVGGHDLYYTLLLEDGTWDVPELMPIYLNSTGQERFPTWNEETRTLYYSSDYFAGLGGLDIFKTTLNDDGSWTKPENLLAPYNSSEDDYGLIFVAKDYLASGLKMKAFFTSTRGVYGNDDIYSIVETYPEDFTPPSDTTTVIVAEEEPEPAKTFFLRIQVMEKLFAIQDNPNSYVVGSRKVGGASVKIDAQSLSELKQTDGNGVVIIPIDSSLDFKILAGKEGYLNNQETLLIAPEELEKRPDGYVFEKLITIDRVFAGVEIVIDNIYYDLDKDEIREDAKPALNTIIDILHENPRVVIELASHTDCRGEDPYNLDLSKRRAASAVDYILNEGKISNDRLSSVGYGETKFEINCICESCSEEEHQINRRTTFKIIR